MVIIEPVIRPPSEAGSFLLQLTCGCSGNSCTFCAAYKDKPFRLKGLEEIFSDIDSGAMLLPGTRHVFLMDGDAMAMKNDMLLAVLNKLRKAFPRLSRVSSYANGYNITGRSRGELEELSDRKLALIYLGLESGSEEVLTRRKKSSSVREMIKAVAMAKEAGIKSSVIVLLGLGGKELSSEHVACTIEALNRMQPRYLSFLSVMLVPGTPLYEEGRRGEFTELTAIELLKEAHDILEGLDLEGTVFRTNHASNYLPLEGRLPHDKGRLQEVLSSAIGGGLKLRQEWMRGL